MILRTCSLLGRLAVAILLAISGSVQAQDGSGLSRPERNPLRAAKTGGGEALPLPGDAPAVAWRESEVAAARQRCAELLAGVALDYDALPPLREGRCGAPAPIRLRSVGRAPMVAIEPPATVTCTLAAALAVWLDKTVQPAARATLGAAVIKLGNASAYVCRNRYNGADTPLSEHALANALDISEFVLESGDAVTVLASWPRAAAEAPSSPPPNPARLSTAIATAKPALESRETAEDAEAGGVKNNPFAAAPADPNVNRFVRPADAARPAAPSPASSFVRQVHLEACQSFKTVLGPQANAAHKDHFHFDMKPRRGRALCE